MGLFTKNPLANVIRCDEQNYMIWKWHPEGFAQGDNKRENEIRYGSSLRVKTGETAVFVNYASCGTSQDIFVGPCDVILETANLPVLSRLMGLPYGGKSPFQAEVYFLNTAYVNRTRFGVPWFQVFDPRYPDYSVPVAVRGEFSYHISDCQEFISHFRLESINESNFTKNLLNGIRQAVKSVVINIPAEMGIPVVQLESKIGEISEKIRDRLRDYARKEFAVEITAVDIEAVEVDKDSDEYRQLIAITKDVTAATIQARAEADVQKIKGIQRIDMADYEARLKAQREEDQYARHLQTQSENFSTYQFRRQADIASQTAKSVGKTGGTVSGFNPAAIITEMAMGNVVGRNMADMMERVMDSQRQTGASVVPPPIPVVEYYIAINNQRTGPYDISVLERMIAEGTLTGQMLVWKKGMADWAKAESVEELKEMLKSAETDVPPIPQQV